VPLAAMRLRQHLPRQSARRGRAAAQAGADRRDRKRGLGQRRLKTPIGAWVLLFVTPAMFATNVLVARLAAGWLPPLALTFWRWFFTALLACALTAGALRASLPALKREGPASLLLGAIGMPLCGA